MTPQQRAELDALLNAEIIADDQPAVWTPIEGGPQSQAYFSQADELYYGGAAGGGKTDLLIGLALTGHRRAIIYRREYRQLRSIEDRIVEIMGHREGYNASLMRWRLPTGGLLEFGACKNPGDERKFRGRPHDLKGFDEISEFTEHQYRFLNAWLRTTEEGQRCRVVCTGNPPEDEQGEWVTRHWAPWLDREHPDYPETPGKLRYYAMIDGKEVETAGPDPIEHKGQTIIPRSRTFIPSRVQDNPYYMATGYEQTLMALPEPLRSQLLMGDYQADKSENPWQVIPGSWLKAAMDRWTPDRPDVSMSSLGVDVARGGRDRTVLTPRYGWWFGEQKVFPGRTTRDGPTVVAVIEQNIEDTAAAQIDVGGPGSAVVDACEANGMDFLPLNSSHKSSRRDRSGKLSFANKRAEWWWLLREALDPELGENLEIPPDPELKTELCTPRWKLTTRGILIEPKDEHGSAGQAGARNNIKARLGRSPDKAESLVYAFAEAAMAGLTPDHFATGGELESISADWLVHQQTPDWDTW